MYEMDFSQDISSTVNEAGSAFGKLLNELYSESALNLPKTDNASTSSVKLNDLEITGDLNPTVVPNDEDTEPEVTGEKNAVESEPLVPTVVPNEEDTEPEITGPKNVIETEPLERIEVPNDQDKEPEVTGEKNAIETDPLEHIEELDKAEVPNIDHTGPKVPGEKSSEAASDGIKEGAGPEDKSAPKDGLAPGTLEFKRELQNRLRDKLDGIMNKEGHNKNPLDPAEIEGELKKEKSGSDSDKKVDPETRRRAESNTIPEQRRNPEPENARPGTVRPKTDSSPAHPQHTK